MLALYSVGFLLYYSVGLRQTPLSGNITNCPALFFVRNYLCGRCVYNIEY